MTRLQSPGYFGQIHIDNAEEQNFAKQSLASCFMSNVAMTQCLLHFETLQVRGRLLPTQNTNLCKEILSMAKPEYIASGEIGLIPKVRFRWEMAAELIKKELGLSELIALPATNPLCTDIQIKTNGTQQEHLRILAKFRKSLRTAFPDLKYRQYCLIAGPCQLQAEDVKDFATELKETKK